MQTDQHRIHQQCCDNCLHCTDENRLSAHVFQLGQAEFVTHGKCDETQGSLGQDALCLHLFHGLEAKATDSQSTKAVRSQ